MAKLFEKFFFSNLIILIVYKIFHNLTKPRIVKQKCF